MTIHKSQGLTFDKIVIDFGDGTFASGQAYVALSRATSFDGLFLKQKMHSTDIYVDEEIKDFAKTFNDKNTINENLSIGRKLFRYQKNNDHERIGDLYFDKATTNLKNGNFKSTFKELMLGFENVSCDCFLLTLMEKNNEQIKFSFKTNSINCSTQELDFIRAVFYFFIEYYDKALTFINSFLEENEQFEVGHYLKGRILAGLKNFEDAISEMELALSIKETSRVYYRLGRYKEQNLEQFGIDKLLQSVLLNPSSLCSNHLLKDSAFKREIKLKTNNHKFLANKFNNSDTEEYLKTIDLLLKNGSIQLADNSILSASVAFSDFLTGLKADENLFGKEINKDSNDNDEYDN